MKITNTIAMKKAAALAAAVVMSFTALCGCSKSGGGDEKPDQNSVSAADTDSSADTESKADTTSTAQETAAAPEAKLVIDGEEVNTDGLVMLTVNGRDIDFDTFRYYYFGTLREMAQTYGTTLDSLRQSEGGFEALMERTLDYIKQDQVTFALAEKNDITLTDEDRAQIKDTYDNIKKNAGSEEEFVKQLADGYLTDAVVKTMLEHAALYDKTADLFVGDGVYATSREDFRNIVKDPEVYACVRSILIPYACKAEITDEADKAAYDGYSLSEKMNAKNKAYNALSAEEKEEVKAKSKALAEEVLEKAKNGEDFEALLSEYGWDPGMEANPQGYYMTHETSFVPEFLNASFALEEGSVVDELVVSDSYGWFIIKRMPIDMDYVEEQMDSMIVDYDLPSRQKIYTDIMNDMKITYSDVYNKLTIDSIS